MRKIYTRYFLQFDCGDRSKNGQVSLSAVIERLQSKFTFTVNDKLERIAIKKMFRLLYAKKGKKVYNEEADLERCKL